MEACFLCFCVSAEKHCVLVNIKWQIQDFPDRRALTPRRGVVIYYLPIPTSHWISQCSSGSSGRVRGGARNMKSMRPPSVAIFFMTYFHRARGGAMAPSAPPGSATAMIKLKLYNWPHTVFSLHNFKSVINRKQF